MTAELANARRVASISHSLRLGPEQKGNQIVLLLFFCDILRFLVEVMYPY